MCLAIPARIVELLSGDDHRAVIDVAGVKRRIDVSLLADDPAVLGDWVLVHVGFAMSKINEAQALDQLQTLQSLGETDAVREEVEGYGFFESAPENAGAL